VSYRYGASVEDAQAKHTFDVYYLRRRTLFLDLRILMATVWVVLLGIGAR
jgi:lipopolysaccharide/colanic/teichoic acid biosynthesis glycosyltransferase